MSRSLTTHQRIALAKLVEGATITEAARAAGVKRPTCSAWVNRNGLFQERLREAQERALRHAGMKLANAASYAVDCLLDCMKAPSEHSHAKVAAARTTLAAASRYGAYAGIAMPGDTNGHGQTVNVQVNTGLSTVPGEDAPERGEPLEVEAEEVHEVDEREAQGVTQ